MSNDDLVQPTFRLRPFEEHEAKELPTNVTCSGCGSELITLQKDEKRRKVSVHVHTKIPPTILNRAERVGLLTCEVCGAKSQFDLLIFGGR